MSNSILPALPGIKWDNTTTPSFATKIQQAVGGIEVRASFQPYPIRKYELSYEYLRSYGSYTELASLYGFYCLRLGAFDSFLFDDPEDDSVTAMQFGTGDGSTVAFQLLRTIGGFSEPVYNTHSTPLIYNNGVLQTAGADYNISASGVVTFTSAPANGHALTWTGTYYWRCRFEGDSLTFAEFASLYWEAKTLAFRTVLGA